MTSLRWALAAPTLLFCYPLAASQNEPVESQGNEAVSSSGLAETFAQTGFDAFTEQLETDPNVPAFGIGVLGCEQVAVHAGGIIRIDGAARIGPGAVFNIGSNAKSVLATAAGRMHDRGELSLDATIGGIWPEIAEKHPDKAEITLAQLFSHRSGLPAFNTGAELEGVPDFSGEPAAVRKAAAEWFLSQPLAKPIGEETLYSNAGYVVVGYLLELASGKSLANLLDSEVFRPLGITADLGEPRNMAGSQPFGHYVSEGQVVANTSDDPPIPPFLEAAGNVSFGPLAYARYLQAHLCALRGDSDFLSPNTARRIHTPEIAGGSGLGWGITKMGEANVSFHIGGTGDFTTYAALSPDQNRAVFVMMSVGGDPASVGQLWLIEAIRPPK